MTGYIKIVAQCFIYDLMKNYDLHTLLQMLYIIKIKFLLFRSTNFGESGLKLPYSHVKNECFSCLLNSINTTCMYRNYLLLVSIGQQINILSHLQHNVVLYVQDGDGF